LLGDIERTLSAETSLREQLRGTVAEYRSAIGDCMTRLLDVA
jgi:hypothetical protein